MASGRFPPNSVKIKVAVCFGLKIQRLVYAASGMLSPDVGMTGSPDNIPGVNCSDNFPRKKS